jgi:hypothetical protein
MNEPRLCCNCLHCARWKKKNGIECHCDLDDRYLGYLTVMDEENDCKHWEKETKWDLEREHDKQIRADAIDDCKTILKSHHMFRTCEDDYNAKIEAPFYKRLWKSFEQLKEQNNVN